MVGNFNSQKVMEEDQILYTERGMKMRFKIVNSGGVISGNENVININGNNGNIVCFLLGNKGVILFRLSKSKLDEFNM